MSLTLCVIHYTQQSDKAIYVSRTLIKQLRLVTSKEVTLKLGHKSVHAYVKPMNKKGKHIYLPLSVRNHIRIPRQGACLVSSNNPTELQIGPLIGIMTTGNTQNLSMPFGGRTALIKQYLRVGAKKAFYFAFTPRDINWDRETVDGLFIGDNGGWVRKTVPLPNAVYNRMASRSADSSVSMEGLKQRFVHRHIPIFNWSFFNKWEVYNMISGEPEHKYVPESYIDPPSDKIKDMLHRHNFLYLKPTGGSLGNGIYRLTYHPKKGYFVRYRRNGSNALLRFGKFSELMKMLHRSRGRMKNYVVQQGIRLIEIDSCPIDFRFHMNKNAHNQWVVAGIGAKKAGKGSVTTHLKNGGQLMTPEQALEDAFGSRADEVLQKAKGVAIKLSEAIDRNHSHLLGELGFDLGVDNNEKIWMFEANAKPGRSIFKHPLLKAQGKASLFYIFEYCLYLSKFRARREA